MAELGDRDPRQVIENYLGQSLDGPAGNAWAVMSLTGGYLREAGLEPEAVKKLLKGARDSDYDHLLRVCAEALLEA